MDIAQQQRIRQALMAYAEAHGIGAVKLARRISEAHPRRPDIPVKTLQRFLAGRKVNEQMMAFCDHFVRKHDVQDRVLQLGESLARIHATPTNQDISGNYILSRNNIQCPVTITKEGDFWRMIEHDSDKARIYEGVVVHMSGVFAATLRDRGFGLPRNYHFTRINDGFLCDAANRFGLETTLARA